MTTGTRFHPWRRLRDLGPSWRLTWTDDLPYDVYGFTDHRARAIVLRKGLSFEERRCTITHEVEHVLRGPYSRCDLLREEAAVDQCSARLLMPSMQDVADALVFNRCDYESAAEDLWVDPWMLEVRLGTLRGLERDYLNRRLADVILGP